MQIIAEKKTEEQPDDDASQPVVTQTHHRGSSLDSGLSIYETVDRVMCPLTHCNHTGWAVATTRWTPWSMAW